MGTGSIEKRDSDGLKAPSGHYVKTHRRSSVTTTLGGVAGKTAERVIVDAKLDAQEKAKTKQIASHIAVIAPTIISQATTTSTESPPILSGHKNITPPPTSPSIKTKQVEKIEVTAGGIGISPVKRGSTITVDDLERETRSKVALLKAAIEFKNQTLIVIEKRISALELQSASFTGDPPSSTLIGLSTQEEGAVKNKWVNKVGPHIKTAILDTITNLKNSDLISDEALQQWFGTADTNELSKKTAQALSLGFLKYLHDQTSMLNDAIRKLDDFGFFIEGNCSKETRDQYTEHVEKLLKPIAMFIKSYGNSSDWWLFLQQDKNLGLEESKIKKLISELTGQNILPLLKSTISPPRKIDVPQKKSLTDALQLSTELSQIHFTPQKSLTKILEEHPNVSEQTKSTSNWIKDVAPEIHKTFLHALTNLSEDDFKAIKIEGKQWCTSKETLKEKSAQELYIGFLVHLSNKRRAIIENIKDNIFTEGMTEAQKQQYKTLIAETFQSITDFVDQYADWNGTLETALKKNPNFKNININQFLGSLSANNAFLLNLILPPTAPLSRVIDPKLLSKDSLLNTLSDAMAMAIIWPKHIHAAFAVDRAHLMLEALKEKAKSDTTLQPLLAIASVMIANTEKESLSLTSEELSIILTLPQSGEIPDRDQFSLIRSALMKLMVPLLYSTNAANTVDIFLINGLLNHIQHNKELQRYLRDPEYPCSTILTEYQYRNPQSVQPLFGKIQTTYTEYQRLLEILKYPKDFAIRPFLRTYKETVASLRLLQQDLATAKSPSSFLSQIQAALKMAESQLTQYTETTSPTADNPLALSKKQEALKNILLGGPREIAEIIATPETVQEVVILLEKEIAQALSSSLRKRNNRINEVHRLIAKIENNPQLNEEVRKNSDDPASLLAEFRKKPL